MPTRTARTAWNGGLQDGSGQVELTSSGRRHLRGLVPQARGRRRRRYDEPRGADRGSPLLVLRDAALQRRRRGRRQPQSLDVTADVSLGKDPAGGSCSRGSSSRSRARSTASTRRRSRRPPEQAKAGCPVSKALTGVEITLEASLAG